MATQPQTPRKSWRYETLADRLRDQIASGELKPGDRLPSFTEMRAQFDASPLTVDRMYALLEDEGLVVREARRGVFVAEFKKRTATGVIGVLGIKSEKRGDPYYSTILSGIQDAAFRAGLEILLLRHDSAIHWEKVDGVLLITSSYPTFRRILPPRMVCVSMIYTIDEIPSVVADDFGGLEKATQFLIEKGHRRIAYLTMANHPLTDLRIAGYYKALRRAGIEPGCGWLRVLKRTASRSEYFREWAYHSTKEWLDGDWTALGCTALLTQNDWVATGAITAFREAGLRVPEDVSIIGFDDLSICEYVNPPLSSIEVPLYEIGTTAVEVLIRRMTASDSGREKIVLPTHLHQRQSAISVTTSHDGWNKAASDRYRPLCR